MKIQYALVSCNTNPRYTAYWPTVAAAWLKLGITPVCLFIPDKPDLKLPPAPEGSIVHTIPPLEDVHIMPQVLMLRFWASHLYPQAVITTADIDCIPLSKHFFHTRLAKYPEHAYLHLKPDPKEYIACNISDIPEQTTHLNLPYLQSWFHVARGKVMQELLELPADWATTCKKILPYYLQKKARIRTDMHPRVHFASEDVCYFGDEIYTSIRLHHSNYASLHYISYQPDQYPGLIGWHTIFYAGQNIDLSRDDYVGIHLARLSYAEGKEIIEHLLRSGSVPKLAPLAQRYIQFWHGLINLTDVLKDRIKIVGPWAALILNVLLWSIFHILPLPRPHTRIFWLILWYKRDTLLRQHPPIMRFFHQFLKIKNAVRPK